MKQYSCQEAPSPWAIDWDKRLTTFFVVPVGLIFVLKIVRAKLVRLYLNRIEKESV